MIAIERNLIWAVDCFIPANLRMSTANLWRARIFVISHLLGPCSAIAILGYLYSVLAVHDFVFWTLAILCCAFWLLPVGLRLTGALTWLAFFSFCDLTFVSVFGSFFFGGVSSPFLPWFLTALLIGFFYLSDRPMLVLAVCALHLTGFVVAYGLNGSFPERVPVTHLSTVGVISICAATLYTSMMAIYYAYVMIAQSALREEIEKHLVTAARLRQAKQEAERANEAKAIFLAKMNHQLRTPLNAIIGYSEILLEEMEQDANAVEASDLNTIHSAGRHLLSLVSDVLYMPKIDANDIEISLQPVEITKCLNEVASTCRNLVAEGRNEFALELGNDLGVIETDEMRLRQILINLLGNAGKFTKNGKVTLRASRIGSGSTEELVLIVQDTGIGIAPEALKELFTNFNSASAVTSKTYGGSGLGLAVSHRLAALLGGDIVVESVPNHGSTFTVRLPVVRDTLPIAA